MRSNQAIIYATKSSYCTSAIITVWCTSVTRALPRVHKLYADVRSQAIITLQNTCSWALPDFTLIYWMPHAVQQLRDLLDKLDWQTLVPEHKEQNTHCDSQYHTLSVGNRNALCSLVTVGDCWTCIATGLWHASNYACKIKPDWTYEAPVWVPSEIATNAHIPARSVISI